MRALARLGGVASGETRRRKKVAKILELPKMPAEMLRRPNRSGGSHESDWRCPGCRAFNSIHRRACSTCECLAPANGRLTKRALRERAAEHWTEAILRKHGL